MSGHQTWIETVLLGFMQFLAGVHLKLYLKTAKKELSKYLDSPVTIKSSAINKGNVSIPFKNKKDFYRILNLLKRE